MRTLARGSLNAEDVALALRSLDVTRERVTTARPASRGTYLEDVAKAEPQEDESDLDTEDEVQILAEIDSLDMDETQAEAVLAEVKAKRKTWAQNKDFKRNMRTDRQRGNAAGT